MELDIKQQVLMAIYAEYQKDLPNIESISNESIGVSKDKFYIALIKLDNEGLINGLKAVYGGDSVVPQYVVIKHVNMSIQGIEYVEEKLGISQASSAQEKVKKVIEDAGKFGYEQLKDFGAKVLAEIIANAVK